LTESSRAVFLSYASQDAPAALRICEALRAAGIEVWFDQSELRGGDAWDAAIRRQIKSCVLFIPIISWNAHTRGEGYFRLEWKLAVDRSHLIASDLPFLVPVVIDDTPNTDERIPDRFREIQWTRLPAGDTSAAFVTRIQRLLAPEAATPESTRPQGTAAHAATPSGLPRPRRGMLYGAVALVGLVVLGYLGYVRLGTPTRQSAEAASIAVLPLRNESGEPGQQYFSDGISEDLITALSQLPGIKVIGRTSAFQFRDSKEDSRSIGAKLGVRHLLEGSVRKSGDVIRVSAELIDTADGSTQWSERYDRPYKDLFTVQDEITHAVAAALQTKLLSGQPPAVPSERPPGGSLDAYNAVLQGRFFSERHTDADSRKAVEFFDQATTLDPHYALAWAELSRALSGLAGEYLAGAEAHEAYVRARATADRALALAPDLPAAHLARGFVLQNLDFNWSGAEAEFREALKLAPNGDAKFALSNQLASIGRLEEAIAMVREVLAVEPLRANTYNWLAMFLLGQDRLDEAEKANRRAIELRPNSSWLHQTLALIQVRRGNAAAALEAARAEPPGPWQNIAMAMATQASGDHAAAEAALRKLIAEDAGVSAYQIAQVYALRNDAKSTFEWLDRAYENRDGGIGFLLYDPFLMRYRDDPRMAAYCHKVGLPAPAQAGQRA
jgi:TolB-like protein/tetratricopeptide (TPR) repeat protein